ncbi:hypothetical protein BDZ91DRAFT_735810 [Kalaharituber pfeilii]|nr:hypothetical protein BDZ91DRAFT_735810 [Kalaharituber pfeilii]
MSIPLTTFAPTGLASASVTRGLPQIAPLRIECDLLHLLFHRNKNQHRVSKWWRQMCLFRSTLKKLVRELEELEKLQGASGAGMGLGTTSGMTKTEKKRLKKEAKMKGGAMEKSGERAGREKETVEKRLVVLRKKVIPECYVGFSSLIATNQFTGLGMVLLGVLARISRIVGGVLVEEGVRGVDIEFDHIGIVKKRNRHWLRDDYQDAGGTAASWVAGDVDVNRSMGVTVARELEIDGREEVGEKVNREHLGIWDMSDAELEEKNQEEEEEEGGRGRSEYPRGNLSIDLPIPLPETGAATQTAPGVSSLPELDFFNSTLPSASAKRKSRPTDTAGTHEARIGANVYTEPPRKRKRKKVKDGSSAIDDLFKGLV